MISLVRETFPYKQWVINEVLSVWGSSEARAVFNNQTLNSVNPYIYYTQFKLFPVSVLQIQKQLK